MPVKFPVTKMCPLHTDSPVLRSWCFSTVKWQLSFLDCFSIFSIFRLLEPKPCPQGPFHWLWNPPPAPWVRGCWSLKISFLVFINVVVKLCVDIRIFLKVSNTLHPNTKKVKKTIFRYPILSVSKLSHLSLCWRFRTPLIFTSRFALLNSQNECVGKIKEEEGPGNWSQK